MDKIEVKDEYSNSNMNGEIDVNSLTKPAKYYEQKAREYNDDARNIKHCADKISEVGSKAEFYIKAALKYLHSLHFQEVSLNYYYLIVLNKHNILFRKKIIFLLFYFVLFCFFTYFILYFLYYLVCS